MIVPERYSAMEDTFATGYTGAAMIANLHLHSRFSDGTSWPEDIALDAARSGLDAVALTDHDTMAGTERFLETCRHLGLDATPGCELDINEPELHYKSELLAYFPGMHGNWKEELPRTARVLEAALERRFRRIRFFIENARSVFSGKKLSFEDLFTDKTGLPYDEQLACSISWSKVDLFLYLKARKCIDADASYKYFKRRYFGEGVFQKFRFEKPDALTVIESVHGDGGFVVLPHLGHLWNDDLHAMQHDAQEVRHILSWFRERGVDGIELYWYNSERKSGRINEYLRTMAEPMGYFFTYGSDCHGPGSDKHTISLFKGKFTGFPSR
ncbi:MAG: PHP domain-containing protein [Rectinemataceae bacterium]|nr:PHP domain-containing protein [Spirochaetaceae bacterium]